MFILYTKKNESGKAICLNEKGLRGVYVTCIYLYIIIMIINGCEK